MVQASIFSSLGVTTLAVGEGFVLVIGEEGRGPPFDEFDENKDRLKRADAEAVAAPAAR